MDDQQASSIQFSVIIIIIFLMKGISVHHYSGDHSLEDVE
jgi:hypothetical protein